MSRPTQPIPTFAREAQERAHWESHDSTGHLDWSISPQCCFAPAEAHGPDDLAALPQHLRDSIKVAAHTRDVPSRHSAAAGVRLSPKKHARRPGTHGKHAPGLPHVKYRVSPPSNTLERLSHVHP